MGYNCSPCDHSCYTFHYVANGRKTKDGSVGNPNLDLILSQWIEEALIQNDHSEIERYDSGDDSEEHIKN